MAATFGEDNTELEAAVEELIESCKDIITRKRLDYKFMLS
jgi:hypothetical protein